MRTLRPSDHPRFSDIAAFRPSTLFQPLPECREASLRFRIVLGEPHQHAYPPHAFGLLRTRREWQCGSRAAQQRDELAASHSITSSAATSSLSGTVRPSILAVSALMTSSNLLACTTGMSVGLASLRMRPL